MTTRRRDGTTRPAEMLRQQKLYAVSEDGDCDELPVKEWPMAYPVRGEDEFVDGSAVIFELSVPMLDQGCRVRLLEVQWDSEGDRVWKSVYRYSADALDERVLRARCDDVEVTFYIEEG